MAVSHTGQSSLVHSLATLLRNDGDLVLDGSSTLTLQASSLQQLTRLFEQYLLSRSQQHGFLALPSHPADTASLLQLQFLFDVLQKTVSLKLINPLGERLQSVVKIFPFKSLKCLELKRIPPHCLEGLRGVYSQLEVFTCSKSLSSLEELLSLCGGDLSSALPWLELHTLNFSYNSIVCLDQSLSLLNVLKFLDLSHNKIQECAEFLKPLTELEHLNLGYNCLQRAPTLGLSGRAKLLTLILRNNELETINGVEQLSSLQHLDLAYNLLLEHSQLAPLSLLHCLNTLNLEGNPLYFQKTHRTCTVRHLSPKAAYLRVSDRGDFSRELSILCYTDHLPGMKSEYVPSPLDIVLPHQQEIERMSSFRDQLGEDWLRYQHHLDGAPPSALTAPASANQPAPHSQTLPNGLSMSTVKFGEPGEFPSLLVVSNQRIYFLEMTSETHGQLSDWLQKRDSHPITELSYLEVGLGSQSIHMEFEEGGVAYTLLVRDSSRCKRFFGLLTGIVREMASKSDSKLRSISTTRLNPQHHLWYAPVRLQDIWTPLTVLATRETLYLLNEDHQWRKSSPNLTANENADPCSGTVTILETQPISCVSSVHLWPSDPCRMNMKLYDETVKQEKTWSVRSESGELLQGLLAWVRARWEAMFGVKLSTTLQDTTS
uniref:Serine/threonine-protein kinase 11-interacting protein n=1 Tax=Myripristis murdjan TaxID=586833 RepID=A0A667WLF7_9TELE